jgi:geranylgeranyl diphosphate synthase type II
VTSSLTAILLTALVDPLADLRSVVDGALDAALTPRSEGPARLWEAMRYSVLAPGKRLRPGLVLAAAEACGGTHRAALPAAVAVELIHTYSLIHDDLPAMDDDDLRRGMPTCHVKYDEATAILAGDALLAVAFETIAGGWPDADRVTRAVRVLAAAAGPDGLVGGQVDDLAAEGQPGTGTLSQLESIHRRKTGALFQACLELGGIAAGATAEQHAYLRAYAEPLGLAFQIVDDLLDRSATTAELGKSAGKDLQQGKLTYPALLGVVGSQQRAQELVAVARQAAEWFGTPAIRLVKLADYVLVRSH